MNILFAIEAVLEHRRHLDPCKQMTGNTVPLFAVKGASAAGRSRKAVHCERSAG